MECYKGENIMDFAFIPAIISALLYIFDFTSMSAAVGIVSGIIAVIMGETLIHSFAQIILTLILESINSRIICTYPCKLFSKNKTFFISHLQHLNTPLFHPKHTQTLF